MRSVTAILLLLLFTAHNELGQLFRLPFFVQHYISHKQQNGNLSLIDFLQEHYNAQHVDDDVATDRQLPFNHYNSQTLTLIYLPTAPLELIVLPQKMFQNPFNLLTQFPLSQRQFSIFHPPQTV